MRDASTAVPSQRELQQSAVAELGQLALAGCPFDMLCDRAVSDLARHLDVRFVKLLELDREGRFLTIRAGCGWKPGLVGTAQVPADSGSQAGYTLGTADTVVVQDFRTETRFAPPKLLTDHGILCGVSVIVGPLDDPWGVLGVHESDPALCGFTRPDIDFVRSVANILWLYLKNERTRGEVERERAALRSFADAMPSLFSIVDSTGHYEFVNRAYAIHGIEPASIVGRSVADVVGEDQYRKLRPHMDQALAGNVVSFETALALATTGPRDFLVTYAPRRSSEGPADGFYATIVDITDQKRRQREILERTQQFRAIADSIPYGIWTCDAAGRLTYVSDSFLDLVGMNFAEARDFGWLARLLPGSADATRLAWDDCVARRGDWEREHRILGSDGRHYDILAIARPVFGEDGELLSYVGLNLDITERKQREEKLSVLSGELDHRVKNVFALVNTIARMSARSAESIAAYTAAFEGRLQSLTLAHELVVARQWDEMTIGDLMETELSPFLRDNDDRVRVGGPKAVLTLSAIQPLALALHELMTNAAKHGALAHPEGRLDVTWEHGQAGGIAIDWTESGLVDLAPPERRGFGSKVLDQVLVLQLGAKVDMDFRASGLRVRIALPDGNFRLQDA